MDYTQLTVDDEMNVIKNKIREAEAQHFAHTTDIQTLKALGVDEEKIELIQNAINVLEGQVEFLNTHLQALVAYAEANQPAE
jgi:hypothetical protein